MPSVFPNGIQMVVAKTGWPIVAHNRYWSKDTDYAMQVSVGSICLCMRVCTSVHMCVCMCMHASMLCCVNVGVFMCACMLIYTQKWTYVCACK